MRLIDADNLRKSIEKDTCPVSISYFYRKMRESPTIDAVPVVHGRWIFHTFEEIMDGDWIVLRDWQGNGFECSNCERLIAENEMNYKFKYCPNCGAKMDEVSE